MMTPRYAHLMSANCSAVLELSDHEAPLWRYWGPRLPDDALPGFGLRAMRATPTFSLEDDFPLSLFPTFGVGWFGTSALLAHREHKVARRVKQGQIARYESNEGGRRG